MIVKFRSFECYEKVVVYIKENGVLIVVKVDGLVVGKGVVVVIIVKEVLDVVE